MAISLKHAFTSAIADGGDTSLVQPSNWNAEHNLTMATARILGRTTAGTGSAEEISVGTGLSLSAGSLAVGATTPQTDTTNTFTASQIISVTDNTNAALRITQLGTGEAIRVEDSTNPDSTAFVVDASGAVTTGGGITANGSIALTAATTEGRAIEIGSGRSGNGNAYIDFIGDATYTDYGLRIIRGASGANAASQIAQRGTGTFSIYCSEAAAVDIYTSGTQRFVVRSDGNIGIGSAGSASTSFGVSKNITGATTSIGISANALVQPDVTTQANYFYSGAVTAGNGGTPYTLSSIVHYNAIQGTLNADSTVSSQTGFSSGATLIGATNNYAFLAGNTAAVTTGNTAYGFYSGVNTATGGGTTYGFYAAGTANNVMPNLSGGTAASSTLTLQSTTGAGTTDAIIFKTASQSERFRIGTAGQLGIGGANYGTSGQTIISGGSAAAPSWGTLGVAGGGTGATTAAGALNALTGGLIITSAGGTTTLTNTSARNIVVTGTLAQTIQLPDVTTLALGWEFNIQNGSSGVVTVQSSGANAFSPTIQAGHSARFVCIAITGTGTASWQQTYYGSSNRTGSGSQVYASSPTLTTPNLGTPSAVTLTNGTGLPLTTGVTGTLPVANGGTGVASATAYALIAGGTTSTGAFQSLGTGTSGQVLTSGGASALPSWVQAGAVYIAGGIVTNSASLSFTSISSYSKLLLITSHSTTSTSARTLNVALSSNNGTSYGTANAFTVNAISTTSVAAQTIAEISNTGSSGTSKTITGYSSGMNNNAATVTATDAVTTGVINAIQITCSGTVTSGFVTLWGIP